MTFYTITIHVTILLNRISMTRNLWLAFALACASFLIRSQGIFLIIAIAIWLATQRRWKPLLILGGMAAATQAITMAFIGFGRYGGQFLMKNPYNSAAGQVSFGDLVERLTTNLILYIRISAEALVPLSAWHGLSIILGLVIIYIIARTYVSD